jgi:hypothetical protein
LNQRKPLKRLYYIPGILSLVMMPVFFFMQINKYLDDRKEYAIPVYYHNNSDTTQQYWQTSKIPANRKYFLFELEQNKKKDSLKLLMIQNLLKGIEQSKDTTYGVKIIFPDNVKYGTIIQAMDACLKAKINTFFLRPHDTLITFHRAFACYPKGYYEAEDTTANYPVFGKPRFLLCGGVIFERPEVKQTLFDKLREYKPIILISLPYFIWLLVIAYLMFRKLKHENTNT